MPNMSESYSPTTVQQAWDNHFAAFGAQDVDKILLDYDETSVIRKYDSSTGKTDEFKGLEAVRGMFTALFKDLPDISTLAAPEITVEEGQRQVFLVWKAPGVGFEHATDTFLFGPDMKIKRQNIMAVRKPKPTPPVDGAYSPQNVQEAWDNHFSAFGAQDLDKIMLDYNENSIVRVHNTVAGDTKVNQGTTKIREMFTWLFKELHDLSTLKAPVNLVEEDAKQVWLVWECKGCGFESATDTFVFGDDFKVLRQNIVCAKK